MTTTDREAIGPVGFVARVRGLRVAAARACAGAMVGLAAVAGLGGGLGGCAAQYVVPGEAASFRAMGLTPEQVDAQTDLPVRQAMSRRPVASFPAAIAAVRVQSADYHSYSIGRRYQDDRTGFRAAPLGATRPGAKANTQGLRVITKREVESETDMQRLSALPMTRGVALLNALVVPDYVSSLDEIREAAGTLQADILVVYTFGTTFMDQERTVPVMGALTLGVFPDTRIRVTSTASAAFVDVRTGFIYGLAEGSADNSSITNFWNTEEAADSNRKKVEAKAFAALTTELERTWLGIVQNYGPASAQNAPPSAAK
jgi:hypothetical protein